MIQQLEEVCFTPQMQFIGFVQTACLFYSPGVLFGAPDYGCLVQSYSQCLCYPEKMMLSALWDPLK